MSDAPAPTSDAPSLRAIDSLEALEALDLDATVVVCGSKPCGHCPRIKALVAALQPVFAYSAVYVDVHEVDDVAERYAVHQLPALVIAGAVHQAVRNEARAKELLAARFRPHLPTEDDF